jgi:hypothetical protein
MLGAVLIPRCASLHLSVSLRFIHRVEAGATTYCHDVLATAVTVSSIDSALGAEFFPFEFGPDPPPNVISGDFRGE